MKKIGYWIFAGCLVLAGCSDDSDISLPPEQNEDASAQETNSTQDSTSTPDTTESNPTTEDPTTEDPTTEDPTTEDPTTQDPTTEDPTTEDPTTEDPTTQDPTTEDPTTEDPTTEDPTTEDPTTEDPTTEDPTTEDPTTEDPTPEDPTPTCGGTICDGECFDISSSNSHCGGCGYACGAGLHCVNYNCACTDTALTKCGWNNCVNLKTDPNHCGACGTVCSSGTCNNGTCAENTTTPTSGGQHVIDYARKLLFTNTHLCTYDLKTNGVMPTLIDLSGHGSTTNYGYNLNCANFVSSVLIDTGEITNFSGREEVARIRSMCESGMFGYRIIDASQAQAGDIWYKQAGGYSHTELIVRVEGDHFVQIGSNNYGASETVECQQNWSTDAKYSTDHTQYQRIVEHTRLLSDGGVVCSKR